MMSAPLTFDPLRATTTMEKLGAWLQRITPYAAVAGQDVGTWTQDDLVMLLATMPGEDQAIRARILALSVAEPLLMPELARRLLIYGYALALADRAEGGTQ